MACYVCSYKRLNCIDGTHEKISRFQPHRDLKEKLEVSSSSSFLWMAVILCSAKMLARLLLLPAGAGSRRSALATTASLLYLEAYNCKGERCEFRKYFDTEAGLQKLAWIAQVQVQNSCLSINQHLPNNIVRKEADSEVSMPEVVAEEEVKLEAVTEEVEASNEAVAASALLLLPALAGRSRRRASILVEQRIAAIYKKEDKEDNEDED
nr:hypothetical protein CFP56_74013 [Quercus suber]